MRKNSNIVVSLGDDGAVVTCFMNSVLTKRIFVTSPTSSDFADLAKARPEATIHLLLDTIDQNYIFSNIPNVGKVNVSKIVKRKISNEFDPNDINSFLFMGKDERSTRKDLKYLFVSVRKSALITDWLDVFNQLPNRFAGIFLLPLESEDFIKKIRDVVFNDKKGNTSEPATPKKITRTAKKKDDIRPPEWEIFISYNRVGGFRQIVMRDGKLIFTRISQAVSLQTPDAIGTNLGQEAANTLEYIRRIGYYDQKLAVYVICAKEAAAHVDIPGVDQKDIHIFSPFEIANAVHLEKVAQENDKYGDIVFAASFLAAKKRKLQLSTPEINNIIKFHNISTVVTYASLALFIVLPAVGGYKIYDGFSKSSEIGKKQGDLNVAKKQFSQIEDFEKKYGVAPELVKNVVSFNNAIESRESRLADLLSKYKQADTFSKYITQINYNSYENDDKQPKDKKPWDFSVKANFDFSQASNQADILLAIEQFQAAINNAFPDSSVEFSGLPNVKDIKIDLTNKDKKPQIFDISVKISPKK